MSNYPFNDITSCIAWVESQKRFNKKTSLDHMKYFCELLGNPETKFKSIHITGTNGKGSVVSYLRNILMAENINVGCFTSPYIIKFNERISYNGNMISDDEVITLAKKVYDIYALIDSERFPYPTFFEFTTLMSFVYFSEKENLDVAIIEVGIGGLLDSTNVIKPLAAGITNVAFDHMNVLGETLEEILINKIGIIKNDIPAVLGLKDDNLIELVKNEKKNHLVFPFKNDIQIIKSDLTGMIFSYQNFENLGITMKGEHQVENAIIALELINTLQNIFHVSEKAIRSGLKNTQWLGRLETLSDKPLIIVDGAHNIDGITRTTDYIANIDLPKKRCIFACSDDKEKEKMINYLESYFDEIIITSYSYKRHSDAEELFNFSHHHNKIIEHDINKIIDMVYENPFDLNLFIGSLYFVSEIRPLILKKNNL